MPEDQQGLSAHEVNILEQATDSFYGAMHLMAMRATGTIPDSLTTETQVKALIEAGVRNTVRLTLTAVRQAL